MSNAQDEAAERIKEALLEHRRHKNAANQIATKTPARNRSRYASIDPGSELAPSPAKPVVASGSGRDLVQRTEKKPAGSPGQDAPARRRETILPQRKPDPSVRTAAPAVRQAQRLSNAMMEIYFPIGGKVTAKLPNGVLDVVETDKAFGKVFRR